MACVIGFDTYSALLMPLYKTEYPSPYHQKILICRPAKVTLVRNGWSFVVIPRGLIKIYLFLITNFQLL